MNEQEFWSIIHLLDWEEAGDDDAVLQPAAEALSKRSIAEIQAFEDILSRKLHALDTRAHAQSIGTDAYINDDEFFSADAFLYARCVVVANGRGLYEMVLSDPAKFPQDLEFESLLSLAYAAFELKTGEECRGFETSVSYETFSNRTGWNQ
ncbi:DUF4240 domain-containing protein [Microvirga splendida]|uniref:DUF4240 domain-containing protein n=1 Tax=Microvirga splendida TaxID=2795727 RepID=A0ABS0Y2I1_9HYPH|nr:DUF4240 domain-containing protein [Microvirga splendida]